LTDFKAKSAYVLIRLFNKDAILADGWPRVLDWTPVSITNKLHPDYVRAYNAYVKAVIDTELMMVPGCLNTVRAVTREEEATAAIEVAIHKAFPSKNNDMLCLDKIPASKVLERWSYETKTLYPIPSAPTKSRCRSKSKTEDTRNIVVTVHSEHLHVDTAAHSKPAATQSAPEPEREQNNVQQESAHCAEEMSTAPLVQPAAVPTPGLSSQLAFLPTWHVPFSPPKQTSTSASASVDMVSPKHETPSVAASTASASAFKSPPPVRRLSPSAFVNQQQLDNPPASPEPIPAPLPEPSRTEFHHFLVADKDRGIMAS